ncbi:MAG: hypothetical protein ACJAVN_000905, partial [Roseivirga sp.]
FGSFVPPKVEPKGRLWWPKGVNLLLHFKP